MSFWKLYLMDVNYLWFERFYIKVLQGFPVPHTVLGPHPGTFKSNIEQFPSNILCHYARTAILSIFKVARKV